MEPDFGMGSDGDECCEHWERGPMHSSFTAPQYPRGLGLSQSEVVRCGKRGAKLWAALADALGPRGCAPRSLRGMQGHPKVWVAGLLEPALHVALVFGKTAKTQYSCGSRDGRSEEILSSGRKACEPCCPLGFHFGVQSCDLGGHKVGVCGCSPQLGGQSESAVTHP